MSVYDSDIDDDSTIPRIDNNLSEIGDLTINALRQAVFNIEKILGLGSAGSQSSVADRLNVSFNSDGTIKASALTSVGLASLPIDNSEIGDNAGILETKLALDFSTADLNTLIQANKNLIDSLSIFTNQISSDLNSHIGGTSQSDLRHVASHIDLNDVPTDIRDLGFTWAGLQDKDGYDRSATTVAEALDEINTDFVNHQNSTDGAHVAEGISVDTSNFTELSLESDNVQKALENIDKIEELNLGVHRATMHSNGVPNDARSQAFNKIDGYRETVVDPTPVITHVAHNPPGVGPIDSTTLGDNVVVFNPDNTSFIFDSQFSQVRVGDHIRINYGNGLEDIRKVESIRFTPGSEWVVRINGTNLFDSDGYQDGYTAMARIDRELYDPNTQGVFAVASANAKPSNLFGNILPSVIIGDPKGATAVGLGFDPNQLNETHYKLYLQVYPSGNPTEHVISLPFIDVTGDAGASAGKYTLDNIIQATNNAFRTIGYNYRFIAFNADGNFGLMLADSVGGAAFSIISGNNSSGTLVEGSFTDNVIGNATDEKFDGLGLGAEKADLASPAYQATFTDSTAALIPTKIIHPLKNRNYTVNGLIFDTFKSKPLTTDGFWAAEINARNLLGSTVEVTYKVDLSLQTAGLKAGKTIVVQPAVDFDDALYNDVDYGRFIIKDVNFIGNCPPEEAHTLITVINGIHATGSGTSSSSAAGLPVRLYFSEDSVAFNQNHLVDNSDTSINYHRNFEIYVKSDRTTFSHERARLSIQAETSTLLASTNWHINQVSPKLRGYKESLTDDDKHIRLYILRYDSVSGEFDGYIGQRVVGSPTILKPGPISTGRKGEPVRFYDETNIDYIELEFVEVFTVDPGTAILSSANPRFVDIELFSSLELDDEIALLASCEVNWRPSLNTDIVERIIDRRQKGSISEAEFTQSAKDFITAGDRNLHGNGILRGFDFVSVSADDDRKLFYNGGMAVVNGKIIAVNNGSVNIPGIIADGTSLPQTLSWAICINEAGNFTPVLITTSKDQYFADYFGNSYYIDSATFSELVNIKRDLTIISLVSFTITAISTGSITATSTVSDARKFLNTETSNISLTWYANDDVTNVGFLNANHNGKGLVSKGHFNSFEQVKTWINNLGSTKFNLVKVKGNFLVDSMIDFSTLTNPITLDGSEGNIIKVTSTKGFKLGNNITLKNLNFDYAVTGLSFTSGDNFHLDQDAGCVVVETSVSVGVYENITIKNCLFQESVNTNIPPYILFKIDAGDIIKNVKIKENKFEILTGNNNAAIAVLNTDITATAVPAIMQEFIISDNILRGELCIILTSDFRIADAETFDPPGLFASSVYIERNILELGAIGFMVSSKANSSFADITECLYIRNNSAGLIACLDAQGKIITTSDLSSNHLSGNFIIENNTVTLIDVIKGTSGSSKLGSVISKNIVRSLRSPVDIESAYGIIATGSTGITDGIRVRHSSDLILQNGLVQILDNIIGGDTSESTLGYIIGIRCACACSIRGNVIQQLVHNSGAVGISVTLAAEPTASNVEIKDNTIFRSGASITSYISVNNASVGNFGWVTDNTFDSPTVDGTLTGVTSVTGTGSNRIIRERNINQSVTHNARGAFDGKFITHSTNKNISGITGGVGTSDVSIVEPNLQGEVISGSSYSHAYIFNTGAVSRTISWYIALGSFIPFNTKIISFEIDYDGNVTGDWTSGSITLALFQRGDPDSSISSTVATLTSAATGTISVGPISALLVQDDYYIRLSTTVVASSSPRTLKFSALRITYRW